jgi:hypothetical protein
VQTEPPSARKDSRLPCWRDRVIDGAEVADPGSHSYCCGGRDASGIEIPEAGSTWYSAQDVPQGEVREVWYHSDVT